MTDLTIGQRITQAVSVLRGAAVAVQPGAIKRSAELIHEAGYGWGYGEPPPPAVTSDPNYYVHSEPVYEAVQAFANKVRSTPLHLFRQLADGEREELKAHDVLSLITNPNDYITRSLMVWHWVSDLLLAGNSFWFMAGPLHGAPNELWRLNPHRTRVVRDKARYISGYVTEVDGVQIPLDPDEVLHFKMPNPFDDHDLYGLPPMLVAALHAQTGRDMATWNRSVFARDHAVPAGMVVIENKVSDSDFNRLKAEWRASYGGNERKTAFLRGAQVKFDPIGLSQTELDFLNGVQWSAEVIYRVFGTHHLRGSKYAGDAKNLERMFLEQHAWPTLEYLAEELTDNLATFWGPVEGTGKLTLEFEDVRPRERSLELQEDQERSKGLTMNEWRQERGLAPLPGYDDILFVHAQSGTMPAPPQEEQPPSGVSNETPDQPPAPEDTPDQDAEERADNRQQTGEEYGDKVGESTDKAVTVSDLHRELKAWEKFQLKRLGDESTRCFEPDVIPAFLAGLVQIQLDDTDDGEAIKAVFERAHALVDGDLIPAKASYGTPSGTVVLYLDGVEDLLMAQQLLQRSVPSDAPIRWTPREQLHITVAYAPVVDEPAFRDAFQETSYSRALNVTTTRFALFGEGDQRALVLLVEPDEDLRTVQREVAEAFTRRGIVLSEYSDPERWQPHITLAYVAATDAELLDLDVEWWTSAVASTLAFTRGDYINEHIRAASLTPIGVISDEMTAGKAIQATRLDFEMDIDDLLTAARSGEINRRTWATRMRTLLAKYGNKAFRDGLEDGGAPYSEDQPLDPEDRATVNAHLAEHSAFITELGRVLFRTDDGITDIQANAKPAMWFNKSIMPLYQAGRLSAARNKPHLWVHNPLKTNCKSCLAASGQVHRLKDWHRKVVPQSDRLICRGFSCGCTLVDASGERARGRLDRIPLHAGKAAEDSEGEPMAWHAGSLPADIGNEIRRVLGKRVVDLTETDGVFTLHLRDDAGYYKSLDDNQVQLGLTLFSGQLCLVDWTTDGETDCIVRFAVETSEDSGDDADTDDTSDHQG